jgi:hypothetical protein
MQNPKIKMSQHVSRRPELEDNITVNITDAGPEGLEYS